jgi:hypothetical protein
LAVEEANEVADETLRWFCPSLTLASLACFSMQDSEQ